MNSIANPGRRMATYATGMFALFCGFAGVFATVVTAEDEEMEAIEVESTSFVVVRQDFKNGERTEWTVHELGSPFFVTPKTTKNYSDDPRFNTIKRGIEALKQVNKSEDSKKVVIPASGSAVTSGDLEGQMSQIFVINENSCIGYTTKEELAIKSIRKHSWTTFE